MNPRITAKERNLLKGAIRRVFSRSELRRAVVQRCIVSIAPMEIILARPRVKTWCRCESCTGYIAKTEVEVDHKLPIIPVDSTLELMTWDDVVNNAWCDINNLQGLCGVCHDKKTAVERKLRAQFKKERKK